MRAALVRRDHRVFSFFAQSAVAVGNEDRVIDRRAELDRADDDIGEEVQRLPEDRADAAIDPSAELDQKDQKEGVSQALEGEDQNHEDNGDRKDRDPAEIARRKHPEIRDRLHDARRIATGGIGVFRERLDLVQNIRRALIFHAVFFRKGDHKHRVAAFGNISGVLSDRNAVRFHRHQIDFELTRLFVESFPRQEGIVSGHAADAVDLFEFLHEIDVRERVFFVNGNGDEDLIARVRNVGDELGIPFEFGHEIQIGKGQEMLPHERGKEHQGEKNNDRYSVAHAEFRNVFELNVDEFFMLGLAHRLIHKDQEAGLHHDNRQHREENAFDQNAAEVGAERKAHNEERRKPAHRRQSGCENGVERRSDRGDHRAFNGQSLFLFFRKDLR